MPLQIHHHAWLLLHPDRDEAWLQAKLTEGFDVHHLDHDHSNNNPFNLVLIEANDHMMVHEMRVSVKPRHLKKGGRPSGPRRPKVRKRRKPDPPYPAAPIVHDPMTEDRKKVCPETMIKFDAALWAAKYLDPEKDKFVALPAPKDQAEYEAMKRIVRARGYNWHIPRPESP